MAAGFRGAPTPISNAEGLCGTYPKTQGLAGLTAQLKELLVALDAAIKQDIIKEYATAEGDTGSPEVQIAMLSKRISDLTEHLKVHKHDHHIVVV